MTTSAGPPLAALGKGALVGVLTGTQPALDAERPIEEGTPSSRGNT